MALLPAPAIWYRTETGTTNIDEAIITEKTRDHVHVKQDPAKDKTMRVMRDSGYCQYHETRKAAVVWLKTRTEGRVLRAQNALSVVLSEQHEVNKLIEAEKVVE